MIHHWKETGEWLEDTQPTRRRRAALEAGGVSREDLWPSTGLHEVAFALHTPSGTVERCDLPTREEKDAWKQAHDDEWITGTCDYLGSLMGEPWVDDLKTGTYGLSENPWDLRQMRFYAVCAGLLSAHSTATHVSLTMWPRYPADGVPRQIWAEPATREQLMGELAALEQARQNAVMSRALSTPVADPGAHCDFCKSKPACPAWV